MLFHSNNKEGKQSTDILLAGSNAATLSMSLYDTFQLGSFDANFDNTQPRLRKHVFHPYYSTHTLLYSGGGHANDNIFLVPLDLRMIIETGNYLPLIASKSIHLQNLLRYLSATQEQVYKEFRSSQDLPKRFVANIEEALQEKNQCSFLTAAYHLIATGDCYPCMKEWLVDELGEKVLP